MTPVRMAERAVLSANHSFVLVRSTSRASHAIDVRLLSSAVLCFFISHLCHRVAYLSIVDNYRVQTNTQ